MLQFLEPQRAPQNYNPIPRPVTPSICSTRRRKCDRRKSFLLQTSSHRPPDRSNKRPKCHKSKQVLHFSFTPPHVMLYIQCNHTPLLAAHLPAHLLQEAHYSVFHTFRTRGLGRGSNKRTTDYTIVLPAENQRRRGGSGAIRPSSMVGSRRRGKCGMVGVRERCRSGMLRILQGMRRELKKGRQMGVGDGSYRGRTWKASNPPRLKHLGGA